MGVEQFESAPKTLGILSSIRKYWYWIIVLFILLPGVILSISTAIHTHNPALPVFELAKRLFTADNVIQKDVDTLSTNPASLVGMAYPTYGLWKHTEYYWHFFINVIWRMLSNIWLIFFPLALMIMWFNLWDTTSPIKNYGKAFIWFIIYLFAVNAVFLVHDLATGLVKLSIPQNADVFKEYLYTLISMLPFHGIFNLGILIFKKMITHQMLIVPLVKNFR